MDSTDIRVVNWIAGAVNMRDFGGYQTDDGGYVRSGRLYRSGTTHGILPAGLAQLAHVLGIRTVIDLRSERERSRGASAFEDHGISGVHEPLDTGVKFNPAAAAPVNLVRRMIQGEFERLFGSLDIPREELSRALANPSRDDA